MDPHDLMCMAADSMHVYVHQKCTWLSQQFSVLSLTPVAIWVNGTEQHNWLIDWLINWLIGWLIAGLIDLVPAFALASVRFKVQARRGLIYSTMLAASTPHLGW